MSLIHLITRGVEVAGVGECSISVVPGVVQIGFHIEIRWNKIMFFLTKWRSCSLLSQRRLLGKSKARMHSTSVLFTLSNNWYCCFEGFKKKEVLGAFAFLLINWKLSWNQLKNTRVIPRLQGWPSVAQLIEDVGRGTINNHSKLQLFQTVIAFSGELPQNECKSACALFRSSCWQSAGSRAASFGMIASTSAGSGNPASKRPWLD